MKTVPWILHGLGTPHTALHRLTCADPDGSLVRGAPRWPMSLRRFGPSCRDEDNRTEATARSEARDPGSSKERCFLCVGHPDLTGYYIDR